MKLLGLAILFLILSLPADAELNSLTPFLTEKVTSYEDKLYKLSKYEIEDLNSELQQYTLNLIRAQRPRYKHFKDDEISLDEVCLSESALYDLSAVLLIRTASVSKTEFEESMTRVNHGLTKLTQLIKDLPTQNIGLDVKTTKKVYALLGERDQQIILGLPSEASKISKSFSKAEQQALSSLVRKFYCGETYHHGNYALKLLDQYGWPDPLVFGEEAGHSVWLVFQHLDSNPDLQKQFLPILNNAVENDLAKSSWYAYLYDRVMVNSGEKQLYGTQLSGCGLKPLADPNNVNERRLKLGMESVESYLSWVPNCANSDIKKALNEAKITAN